MLSVVVMVKVMVVSSATRVVIEYGQGRLVKDGDVHTLVGWLVGRSESRRGGLAACFRARRYIKL